MKTTKEERPLRYDVRLVELCEEARRYIDSASDFEREAGGLKDDEEIAGPDLVQRLDSWLAEMKSQNDATRPPDGTAPERAHLLDLIERLRRHYKPNNTKLAREVDALLADDATRPPDGTAPERCDRARCVTGRCGNAAATRPPDGTAPERALCPGCFDEEDDHGLCLFCGATPERHATRPPDGMPGEPACALCGMGVPLERAGWHSATADMAAAPCPYIVPLRNAAAPPTVPGEPGCLVHLTKDAHGFACGATAGAYVNDLAQVTCATCRQRASAPPTVPGPLHDDPDPQMQRLAAEMREAAGAPPDAVLTVLDVGATRGDHPRLDAMRRSGTACEGVYPWDGNDKSDWCSKCGKRYDQHSAPPTVPGEPPLPPGFTPWPMRSFAPPATPPTPPLADQAVPGEPPAGIDPKYKSVEVAWIRLDGQWLPTVVLDGIPVQVTVNSRVGLGPLAECWGPRIARPDAAPPTPPLTPVDADEFYLLDTRVVVGNCAMFWCPDGKGYTCKLSEAGLYSRDDAPSHRETDVPVPRALAEEMAVTHVRLDQLRERLAIRDYEKTKSRTERKAWLDKHCPPTPRSR